MWLNADAGVHRTLSTAGCAALLCAGIASTSQAQVGSIGGGGGPSITPPPVATGREDVFTKSGRAEDALIVGDWMAYPSAFGGALYDSNVNQSTSAQSSAGLRLTPSLLAETNSDLSKTTLYGLVDGRLYTNQGTSSADALSVRSGVTEIYAPLPDLRFTGQSDYTRQKDVFSTLGNTNDLYILNPTGVGLSPTANPQSYNQFSGVVSAQKNFASAFMIFSGSVVDQMYDSTSGAVAPSPNGITYTGTARGGFWITPALYGYVEGSLDSRNYATSSLSSSGNRTVVGLGTDQIGLLKGEIYGGYEFEDYQSAGIGTSSSPAFGGRAFYYPLPELTINFAVDQTLGVTSLATTPTSPIGTATKVTSALTTASYAIAPEWNASGRGGYIHTEYVGNVRRDDAWTIGTTFTYNIWRSVGLTLDYQHVDLSSNVPLQSFSRDVVTFGLTYKY